MVSLVGSIECCGEGFNDGVSLAVSLGVDEANPVGSSVGTWLRYPVGMLVGEDVGYCVGDLVGFVVGSLLGILACSGGSRGAIVN